MECPVRRVFSSSQRRESAQGEYGYDTANVDRNFFGATLVEDLFRPISLLVSESECGPSKAGPHFFYPSFAWHVFAVLICCRQSIVFDAPRGISERTQWFRYACPTVRLDNTITR
ncbi:hypothetical protein C0Z18_27420 [Trinickia dabaoshanensis]|uniref:Uncharacterized protein n=1 Tax=Trinickia dabaoshanensis TaxID=564714 RepID=A0A2N7VE33_9BURK|nr:hypothetical protein C0Z18_27420 [Trinickia dabaoshanensis]